ncbi:hypothetical protein SEA_BRYNNIE_1 [Arthrobacter phage Brynnie]|nr:hypothetical protein SEA_BRYNNIE_1 [Arthrobacter phage Brynnie]
MHDEHKQRAIFAAVVEGERVAIFGETMPAAQAVCSELADMLKLSAVECSVRRVNGRHSIDFPGGGRIVFLSLHSEGQRGYSLDRAYVPICSGRDKVREVLPCLSVSGGPLVGY